MAVRPTILRYGGICYVSRSETAVNGPVTYEVLIDLGILLLCLLVSPFMPLHLSCDFRERMVSEITFFPENHMKDDEA